MDLFAANNPTIDKYFRDPLKGLISPFPWATRARPISRLGPNTFATNDKVIVIRYITDKELEKIGALSPEQVFYVVDDDFSQLAEADSLPEDYRKRLQIFAYHYLPEILAMTDTVVAPNREILNAYPGKQGSLLSPAYSSLCEEFSHFDDPATIKLVFIGTRSHIEDLKFLSGMLKEICNERDDVTLTTFLGSHGEAILSGPNIHHRKPLGWKRFKKLLSRERFHIGLAPYLDTPFNQARSINKLHDHSALGAAGIYSKLNLMSSTITDGVNGLLCDNKEDIWRNAIEELFAQIAMAKQIAINGAALSSEIGNPAIVRDFWKAQLSI